jgi:hypothetical protein
MLMKTSSATVPRPSPRPLAFDARHRRVQELFVDRIEDVGQHGSPPSPETVARACFRTTSRPVKTVSRNRPILWFQYGNTVLFRNPLACGKQYTWLLPGLDISSRTNLYRRGSRQCGPFLFRFVALPIVSEVKRTCRASLPVPLRGSLARHWTSRFRLP